MKKTKYLIFFTENEKEIFNTYKYVNTYESLKEAQQKLFEQSIFNGDSTQYKCI